MSQKHDDLGKHSSFYFLYCSLKFISSHVHIIIFSVIYFMILYVLLPDYFLFVFISLLYKRPRSQPLSQSCVSVLSNTVVMWRFNVDADLIVLGFNDTSTLVGHFVCSQKKGEEIVDEMKEVLGRTRMNANRITFPAAPPPPPPPPAQPSTLTCYKDSRPCPTVSQILSVGRPTDARHTRPLLP